MKRIAQLFVFAGICLLLYGGYELYESSVQQNASLTEAHELLNNSTTDTDSSSNANNDGTGNKNDSIQAAEDMEISDGDVIGILYIPRLDKELPIVSGTAEEELARGVGHFTSTVLPGENDQILLSGHRDSVFRGFGDLEIGDQFILEMPYGTFTYEMYEDEIVDADDTSVIRSMAPDEVLTLSTCYPFSYVGPAPDRYIIYAAPVAD